MPHHAPNGAIVYEQTGHGFLARPATDAPKMFVDTRVRINGHFLVKYTLDCLDNEHSYEQRREWSQLAETAVENYLESVREGVNCATAGH